MRRWMIWLAPLVVAMGAVGPAGAETRLAGDQSWCEGDGERGTSQHCEIRETSWALKGRIEVDASPNGGIHVVGGDQGEVRLLAKVVARADTVAAAKELASQVSIGTGDVVRAVGPAARSRRTGWSVSYRLEVPRRADLRLRSMNGGVHLQDVSGTLEFETVNGGLHLARLGGRVRGRTTNGGLHVDLAGQRWEGEGLDLATTNGGVHMAIPEGYSAHLESSTVNGRFHVGFPVPMQGEPKRRLVTDLGRGGAPLRVTTTNGSIHVSQR